MANSRLIVALFLLLSFTSYGQINVYESSLFQEKNRDNRIFEQLPGQIYWITPTTDLIAKKFERMEIAVELPKNVQKKIDYFIESDDSTKGINPFLEWQLDVTATYTHIETGQVIERDGFYYNEFDRDTSAADFRNWKWIRKSTPVFTRVRFAPPQTGNWNCTLNVVCRDTTFSYPTFQFSVNESDNKGFMYMGESKRFFKLGDETFFPSGQNMIAPRCEFCFSNVKGELPSESGKPAGQSFESWMVEPTNVKGFTMYLGYMKALAAGGGNYFREILLPQSQDIEWEKLGNYYTRLNRAWEIDQQLFLAEELELKIQLNLQIQIALERNPDRILWNWSQDPNDKKFKTKSNPCCNPYNRQIATTKNSNQNTFFSDETAKKFYKQKLRYIVARWGYSTSIGMWGMASEIQTPCTESATCVSWIEEMGAYMKENLKVDQLMTPSFLGIFHDAENYEHLILQSKYYDNIPLNWYAVTSTKYQGVPRVVEEMKNKFDRPFFYGEIGNANLFGCDLYKIEWIRDCWMTAFTGTAGIGLNWDYHFVDSLRQHLGNINTFTKGVDFDNNGDPWTPRRVISDNRKVETVYMISPDKDYAIGVISNRYYNWYLYLAEGGDLPDRCSNFVPKDPGFDPSKPVAERGVWEQTYEESPFNYIDRVKSNSTMNDSVDYRVFESFNHEAGKNFRLRLYDLNRGNYTMDFYNALTMEYIGSRSNWGPDVRLEYPELARKSGLIAFKLYRKENEVFPGDLLPKE